MVVHSDPGSTEAADILLSHVSARAIEAVCLLMADSFDLETLMQIIPCCCFIGVRRPSFAMRARMNEAD
jgi:hypothetical protein